MGHDVAAALDEQGLGAQPVAHFVGVFVGDDGVYGVAAFHAAVAVEDGEQVEVVVAEHDLHAAFVLHAEFEGFEGFGAAVDDVSGEPESVVPVVEIYFGEEGGQFVETALDIADCVVCHGVCLVFAFRRPLPRAAVS